MNDQTHTQKPLNTPTPSGGVTLADLERLSAGNSAARRNATKKKRRTRKDPRFRCQFRFWLEPAKPDQYALGMELKNLKSQRRYLPTVRNALRLFLDLRAGRTDVLCELFPWIVDKLKPPPAPSDSGDIQRQIEAAVEAGVQKAMLSLPALPAGELVAAPRKESAASRNTLGKGATFTAAPSADDDGDELVITKKNQPTMLDFILQISEGAGLTGKNYSAEENARTLQGRRLS
jgi:hypothetical protein